MKSFKGYLAVAVGLALVGFVLAIVTAGPTMAQTASMILLRDLENPARHPFQGGVIVDISEGLDTTPRTKLTTVPAGKRLVIEFISINATSVPPGQEGGIMIELTANQKRVAHYIAFRGQRIPRTATYDQFVNTQLVRLYADAGTNVDVFVFRNGTTGQGGAIITFSGYLIG